MSPSYLYIKISLFLSLSLIPFIFCFPSDIIHTRYPANNVETANALDDFVYKEHFTGQKFSLIPRQLSCLRRRVSTYTAIRSAWHTGGVDVAHGPCFGSFLTEPQAAIAAVSAGANFPRYSGYSRQVPRSGKGTRWRLSSAV